MTAEKKRSKEVYARQGVDRDSRYQGGKEQVCGRIKILAFLKGTIRVSSLGDLSAFSDPVGNCRLTKTLQGFTVSRRRIPGTPPGSSSVVFHNDYRRQVDRMVILSRQALQGVAEHRPREKAVLHTQILNPGIPSPVIKQQAIFSPT